MEIEIHLNSLTLRIGLHAEADKIGYMQPKVLFGYWLLLQNNPGLLSEKIVYMSPSNIDWKIIQKIQQTNLQSERIVELLVGLDLSKASRQRRSVLPFIGQVSRFLFGTMDEEAQKDMENLMKLSSNDTLSNIPKSFDYYYKRDTLQVAKQILGQTVSQYKLDTKIITDVILLASQGAIHPRFLSPDLIYKSAELARETVPDPIFPSSDKIDTIIQLMKISDLTIIYSNYQLIYHLSIRFLIYKNTFYMKPPRFQSSKI
ncbi:hypothetical protein TSAR_010624 [Trichomalopsis sarcophagae]|uniref:Uncharacterized protein n=1 Tax=Trichomalopsis sarcophagae TaxID=543379 RepID=A0A232EQZ6_9HYME|nr:hypothetical protein TSAR_010624 [Trichomalopsis sarcophagae]